MYTDPIADMLTRIRNAQAAKKQDVVLPYSKIKLAIASLLVREGWLAAAEKVEAVSDVKRLKKDKSVSRFDTIKVVLKYDERGQGVIRQISRVSKPGRRVYAAKDTMKNVLNGYGISIISSSEGLMTNKEAKKKGVGGEVVCEVY